MSKRCSFDKMQIAYKTLLVVLLVPNVLTSSTPARPSRRHASLVAQSAYKAGGHIAQGALKAGGDIASGAGRSLHNALDDDGDGEVSAADFERTLGRWSRWWAAVRRGVGNLVRRYRRMCLALAGVLGLTHGGRFAYIVLVARTFQASGWPLIREGFAHARKAYMKARKHQPAEVENRLQRAACEEQFRKLQRELLELRGRRRQLGINVAQQEEEALLERIRAVREEYNNLARRSPPVRSVLLRALCDPIAVRDVAVGLCSGVSACLAAARSDAARSLGIGLTLGGAVARACGWMEHLTRRCFSRLPAEAVALGTAATERTRTRWFTQLVGRLSGCWLAFELQSLAMTLSVCLLSARALTSGFAAGDSDVDDDDELTDETALRATLVWVLALGGLTGQSTGRFTMPLLLRVALLPAFAFEALLRSVGNRAQTASLKNAMKEALEAVHDD